jgi:hypothetical protein
MLFAGAVFTLWCYGDRQLAIVQDLGADLPDGQAYYL